MSDRGPDDAHAALVALRDRIEAIDAQLVALVAERQRIAAQVGDVKRGAGQPVLDPAREAAVLRRIAGIAREHAVHEDDARELWRKLLAMARRVQAAGDAVHDATVSTMRDGAATVARDGGSSATEPGPHTGA